MANIFQKLQTWKDLVRERQFCMDDSYSAYWSVMFPLSRQEALTLFDTGQIDIYLIYSDDTEAVCMTRDEIFTHENGCFGVEHNEA